jgi:hypothetical protein
MAGYIGAVTTWCNLVLSSIHWTASLVAALSHLASLNIASLDNPLIDAIDWPFRHSQCHFHDVDCFIVKVSQPRRPKYGSLLAF